MAQEQVLSDVFVLVEAEELSLDDKFLKHCSKTKKEADIQALIIEAIINKVKNFYRPKYDPSFNEDMGICFMPGKQPAVGKSYNWWSRAAKRYNPARNSRLGTKLQYGAFLGVLIKSLVAKGQTVEWAWNAVCNDSTELGHYWNSENTRYGLEPTGSREICGFCDLANTYKMLAEDKETFCLASSYYFCEGSEQPIASYYLSYDKDTPDDGSVGWIVLT